MISYPEAEQSIREAAYLKSLENGKDPGKNWLTAKFEFIQKHPEFRILELRRLWISDCAYYLSLNNGGTPEENWIKAEKQYEAIDKHF